MTIFEAVKSQITPRMAAEHYGLQVSQNGMAKCLFHDDTHPSMKLYDDHFHCFGCQETGDVIHLTAKLFGIAEQEAAQKLAADFGIRKEKESVLARLERYKVQSANTDLCFRAMRDYLSLLREWRIKYAPKSPEEPFNDRFAESLQMYDQIEYMLDVLTDSKGEQRTEVVAELIADGKMQQLREYTERKKKEAESDERRI